MPTVHMRILSTIRLDLEPLRREHASDLFDLLSDPMLYEHLDEAPPDDVEALQQRYAMLESRCSADGSERWLNWIVRLRESPRRAIGYVQATVRRDGSADVAFVIGSTFQGKGFATEAVAAMLDELSGPFHEPAAIRFFATAATGNSKSIALLRRLGFSEIPAITYPYGAVADGDVVFTRESPGERSVEFAGISE